MRHDNVGCVGWCHVRVEGLDKPIASAPPMAWATTKAGTDAGAMPAKVFENMRPTLMAGLAKLVELVKK